MRARREAAISIASGTDTVLFGCSLPSGSMLQEIKAKVQVVGQTVMAINEIAAYAMRGYILPIHDPDSAPTFDTVWDTLVPKDQTNDVLDLDTASSNADNFWEPGEVDMGAIFDVGLRPTRIYDRRRFLTFARNQVFAYREQATDVVKWYGGEDFTINIGRRIRVKQPSIVVFGVSSPNMLQTSSQGEKALEENEWPRVKYFRQVLEYALADVMGLVEAGAETPWEDATVLMKKHLDPVMYEHAAGVYVPMAMAANGEVTFDLAVTGDIKFDRIDTGG